MKLPKYIKDREGKETGEVTGGTRCCAMEGCSGRRVCVRWKEGKKTWPCSRGMDCSNETHWRIL